MRTGSAVHCWGKEEGERMKEEITLIKSRDPVLLCFLCVSIFLWCPIYIYIRSFVLSRFCRILEPVSL